MESECYERYPVSTVVLSNAVSLGIYALGAYVLSGFGIVWLFLFLAYCVWIEMRLFRGSCVRCWYYGKRCAFGRGRLSAVFFKRGNPRESLDQSFTWKDLIPDIMVSLIPLVGGVALAIRHFQWKLIFALAAILALTSEGNALVRGKLACSHCRQREIGCPAATLFAAKQGAASSGD